jgi:MFS family permease
MIAAGPLETILDKEYANWRNMFFILGIIGTILVILVFIFVENKKKQAKQNIILSRPAKVSTSLKRLLMNSQPWLIGILSACLYFSLEYLSENEGRNFLAQKNISKGSASYMLTIGWLGYGIGAPVFGFISDYFNRRKIFLIIGAFISIISTSLIVYSDKHEYITIGFFLLGVSTSTQSIGFAVMAEQFREKFIALGFGLNNAIIMSVAAINAPALGLILENQRIEDIISLESYISTFNILILISAISVIISMFFIRETYCKSTASFTILNTS